MLLNQFHDIIPGTAITETYKTSATEYEQVFKLGNDCLECSLRALAAQISVDGTAVEGTPYAVFNSLGWERDEVVVIEGDASLLSVAAFDHEDNRLPSDVRYGGCDSERYAMSITVSSIPAFGYKTIWLRSTNEGEEMTADTAKKAKFDDKWETGCYSMRQGKLRAGWTSRQTESCCPQAPKRTSCNCLTISRCIGMPGISTPGLNFSEPQRYN
jgi:alpha-mannosidase